MPSTVAPTLLPYPAVSDAPNSPAQMQALAERIALYYPRGPVAPPVGLSASTAYVTAETMITELKVTFTAYSGRRYRALFQNNVFDANASTPTAAVARIRTQPGTTVTTASTQICALQQYLTSSSSGLASGGATFSTFTASGQTSVQVSLASSNTIGVRMFAGGVELLVEDVGPT